MIIPICVCEDGVYADGGEEIGPDDPRYAEYDEYIRKHGGWMDRDYSGDDDELVPRR